jgi:hypothetical protein
MYLIIHETSTSSLLEILKSNNLLKSSEVQKLGLSLGQGSKNRKLTSNPRISLEDGDFADKFDEVDGVYFRLLTLETPIQTNYGGSCVLVFSKEVLQNYPFVINTEENFGFCIGHEGKEAEAQFSGEPGITITNYSNLHILKEYKFNPYSSEIVIMDNVSLRYLQSVFMKKDQITFKLTSLLQSRNIPLYAIA